MLARREKTNAPSSPHMALSHERVDAHHDGWGLPMYMSNSEMIDAQPVGLIPAERRRPFHAAHLRQSLLHEVRAVLHASLHSCLSCLLLHSRLHARCVESHSTLH